MTLGWAVAGGDRYAVALAASADRPQLAHELLSRGADPNLVLGRLGETMLHEGRGRVAVAKALIEGGAQVDARTETPI